MNKPLEAAIQFENVVNEQRHKARVREIDVIGIDYVAIYDLVISVVVLPFRSFASMGKVLFALRNFDAQ